MFWTKKPTRKHVGLTLEQLDERRCMSTVTVLPTEDYSTDQSAEYRADPPQPDKTTWGDPPSEHYQADPPEPDKTNEADPPSERDQVDPPDPDKTGEADPPGVIVGETSNAPWGWGDPPTERAAIYMNDAGEKMGPIYMRDGDITDGSSERAAIYMNELFVNDTKDSPIVGDPFVGDPVPW